MQLKEIANGEKLSALMHLCGHQPCPAESMNQAHEGLLSSFSKGSSLIQKPTPIWIGGSFTHFNLLSS